MKPLSPEKRRAFEAVLKAAYDAVLSEDHSSFHEILNRESKRGQPSK